MKCFNCDNCGMMVFFENESCVKCGETLGFFPDRMEMSSQKKWAAHTASSGATSPHTCANKDYYKVCNWMVLGGDDNTFCLACRLNEMIPNLTINGNRERWYKLELAKRRCLYTFLRLGLPVETAEGQGRAPLRFRFMGDAPDTPPVITGHDHGVITINIAEADTDERERRRLQLNEPYRTLIGHIRHESGHYYWDRIIADTPHLPKFRELFGDETANYDEALKKYYASGPASDWKERTVTAYASLHPWEDWAETWAHYLHMADTLETAESFGLGLNLDKSQNYQSKNHFSKAGGEQRFNKLLATWLPLICALNAVSRGMGLPDLYPFVTTDAVIKKLEFIHNLIESEANQPHPASLKKQASSQLKATI